MHGKESYNECGAYRTVSITDILVKRLEKVILDRITCRFGSHGFDENQFAYLKRRISTQAVLLLAEVIKTNVLSENCIGVVSLISQTPLVLLTERNWCINCETTSEYQEDC